ncbi:conserved hypothetical protein [Nostocoides jenkinsii Ben 74]|uniref:Uncharacterized protein n=1 Tax=Nostocoides jenkinsii Ben 74 TaxID=1193518 RepID=A0A077M7I9_9MICO|nr:conserved hypothetical protein [Tetrasphaera jenkinsii Ben 74]
MAAMPFTRAHPRAGGADGTLVPLEGIGEGSSPRGRGGQALIAQALYGGGLIPARAGRVPGPTRAHPRAGGADAITPGALGLIPARAGRTSLTAKPPVPTRAHPRAGGADLEALYAANQAEGSSPRGRGGRNRQNRRPCEGGLIPARAGRTWLSQRCGSCPSRGLGCGGH